MQERLSAAVRDAEALMSKPGRLRLIINAQLRLIKRRHRLTELTAVRKGSFDSWTVTAKINPEAKFELFSINDEVKELRLAIGTALKTVPKKAKIDEVKVMCARAATEHLAPDHKLDWEEMRDSWVLFLNRKHEKFPRTAVGRFTHATEYKEVDKKKDQVLYENSEKQHYVLDSIGQHVPRILVRNINEEDQKNLRKKKGIKATDPRADVDMWEHVIGAPTSKYISTTKRLSGKIKNPRGDPLGGWFGRVKIDLLWLSPKVIYDPTTKKGQDAWNFSDPKTNIVRQALEDVVRTEEVLIRGEIPQKAITWMDD